MDCGRESTHLCGLKDLCGSKDSAKSIILEYSYDILALSQLVDGLGGFDQLAGGRQAPSCQMVHCPGEGNVEVDSGIASATANATSKSPEVKMARNISGCQRFSMSLSKKMTFSALSMKSTCSTVFGELSG